MKSSVPDDPPYVALVEKSKTNKVKVRWYYRPEDTSSGRKDFHGKKELFLSSNHYDTQSVDCIIGKCTVHTFKEYMKLYPRGSEDYYSRYEYDAITNKLTLDVDGTDGLCICGLPYNPELYVQCHICKSRFHPACANSTIAQAKKLCLYRCDRCQNISPRQERAADELFERLQKIPREYPGI